MCLPLCRHNTFTHILIIDDMKISNYNEGHANEQIISVLNLRDTCFFISSLDISVRVDTIFLPGAFSS